MACFLVFYQTVFESCHSGDDIRDYIHHLNPPHGRVLRGEGDTVCYEGEPSRHVLIGDSPAKDCILKVTATVSGR